MKSDVITKATSSSDLQDDLIQKNDIVTFRKITFPRLNLNDIVLVKKDEENFIARIIYKNKDHIITKGSKILADTKIHHKQIVGKAEIIERSKQKYNINNLYLHYSTIYFNEILKVARVFQESGLNYIFLKGLPLHLFFENSIPKTLYRDCDILVETRQIKKAFAILNKLGYREAQPLSGKKYSDDFPEKNYYIYNSGVKVSMDIHKEILFTIPINGRFVFYSRKKIKEISLNFLSEKTFLDINGVRLPVLSAENFFFYTTLHLFNHNYTGTFRYALLKKVIEIRKLDYSLIAKTIKKYNVENFVYPAIIFISKFYNVKFPSEFIKSISPKKNTIKYINNNVIKNGIFNDIFSHDYQIKAFKISFYLSPHPLYIKILNLLNPGAITKLIFLFFRKS